MKANAGIVIQLVALSISFHLFAGDDSQKQVKQVIASIGFIMDIDKENDEFTKEHLNVIHTHVTNIKQYVEIPLFKPVTKNTVLKQEGTCWTWNSFDWIDYSWTDETLRYLWCVDDDKPACDPSQRCVNASIVTGCTYPVLSVPMVGVATIAHGLV